MYLARKLHSPVSNLFCIWAVYEVDTSKVSLLKNNFTIFCARSVANAQKMSLHFKTFLVVQPGQVLVIQNDWYSLHGVHLQALNLFPDEPEHLGIQVFHVLNIRYHFEGASSTRYPVFWGHARGWGHEIKEDQKFLQHTAQPTMLKKLFWKGQKERK